MKPAPFADRRRLLQGALAGAAASLLPLRAAAQATPAAQGAAASVLGAPRHALVIGNDSYRDSPLKNPRNDARGIAAELAGADFSVSVLLDATLADMRARVEAFGEELQRSKAVGLFYFAGHGIQLSWRNYLLPVDTVISKIDEVRDKALDLSRLLEIMGRAANPANIVILDACRNNPFGLDFRVEQRGLSQVDAPVGTLLAYATAPGNVAIDGEGENGLYTENLLREIRVPDAKVEDIFKRVRLAVRRRSKGQQIPWESTSLEEDFYFLPPEEVRKAEEAARLRRIEQQKAAIEREEAMRKQFAAAEREAMRQAEEARRRKEEAAREAERRAEAARIRKAEEARLARENDEAVRKRQFEEQLAEWERIKEGSDIGAFERFIYRYPSSQFTDLAQLRLDQLLARQGEKRVEAVSAPENPFTKGSARADTAFKVGDTWAYRVVDREKGGAESVIKHVVTAITETEVMINGGRIVLDLLGNTLQTPDGRRFSGGQDMALEYAIGKRWTSRTQVVMGQIEGYFEGEYRVVARERITVPAGSFDCFKVEGKGDGLMQAPKGPAQVHVEAAYWVAPTQVRRQIARETMRRVFPLRGPSRVAQWDRMELVFYKQS